MLLVMNLHMVLHNQTGLNYSKEPGAMNESMSDIMGKSVQFWTKPADINWVLSNDMNWFIRSFANPKATVSPIHTKGLTGLPAVIIMVYILIVV